MGTNVHLTPALEQFARDAVESGRYNNVSEVVRQGLRMLQEAVERQAAFIAMLGEVEAEAERDGWLDAETVLDELDAFIESADPKSSAA